MNRRGWAVALALVLAAGSAAAQPTPIARPSSPAAAPGSGPRLRWNPDWPLFRPLGYGLMTASVAAAIAVSMLVTYPDLPRTSGGVLFDDDVRDGLRARHPAWRDGIRVASDVTLTLGIVNAVVVDSLVLPLADGSPEIAWQLVLMDAQAFSLNILIATLLFKGVARARPPQAQCAEDPEFDPLCDTGSYASFPSSHTSTAFTAAGLSCAHHIYLPLYGGPWDIAACAGSLALATATGLFRIIGDRHYATDVLMGSLIGFGLGYIYPWLFHYGEHLKETPAQNRAAADDVRWGLAPTADRTPYGVTLLGEF